MESPTTSSTGVAPSARANGGADAKSSATTDVTMSARANRRVDIEIRVDAAKCDCRGSGRPRKAAVDRPSDIARKIAEETTRDAASSATTEDDSPLPAPAVSVVLATFNRSNILPFVIGSVLAQTRGDWELIVVGDGCTDDSEDVVARFNDPRIRFINLRQRVGDQSGPNNEGVRQARGRFVAFLNHDDLWFPDHLERTLETLDKTGAALTFTLQLEADPDARWRVNASYPDGGFDPIVHPNASTGGVPGARAGGDGEPAP